MKKVLLALFAFMLGFSGMSAQSDYHLGEITVDTDGTTTFDLKLGGINYFQITAPATGMLEFNVGFAGVALYLTDSQWTDETKVPLGSDTTDEGKIFKCDVKEGETYYFSTAPILDQITVKVSYSTGESSISLSCNYNDGDKFDLTDPNLDLTFSHIVTIDKKLIIYGEGQQEEIADSYINAIFVNNYYYSIMLSDLVSHLMDGGKLDVGDKFTIRLEGIRDKENPDKLYGEDGLFEITFELADMPATLVSIVPADGSEINSFYPEGGDEGFIVFTFSEPLNEDKTNVKVTMAWGYKEAGSYEQYQPDFTIEGNTVTVDIRGILIPDQVDAGRGLETATKVTLTLSGLTTAKGGSVETNYPGMGTSSIIAIYGVKEQENLFYDFIPMNGCASLEGYDEIIIWTNVPILYDGIALGWLDARGNERSRTYTPEQIPFAWDDYYEGYIAHIPITTISLKNGPVTVDVVNARQLNGDPITISGTFNTMATGIDSVVAGNPDADVKVYTIDGRMVREGKAATATQGLEKGVYIVNGKKLLVK